MREALALVGKTLIRGSLPRFVLVGIAVLLIENVVVWMLLRWIDSYVLARVISTLTALLLSYGLNTPFSFASTYSIAQFFSYAVGLSLSLVVTYLVSFSFYYLILNSSFPLLSTNIGALIAALANYYYQRHITYARRG